MRISYRSRLCAGRNDPCTTQGRVYSLQRAYGTCPAHCALIHNMMKPYCLPLLLLDGNRLEETKAPDGGMLVSTKRYSLDSDAGGWFTPKSSLFPALPGFSWSFQDSILIVNLSFFASSSPFRHWLTAVADLHSTQNSKQGSTGDLIQDSTQDSSDLSQVCTPIFFLVCVLS